MKEMDTNRTDVLEKDRRASVEVSSMFEDVDWNWDLKKKMFFGLNFAFSVSNSIWNFQNMKIIYFYYSLKKKTSDDLQRSDSLHYTVFQSLEYCWQVFERGTTRPEISSYFRFLQKTELP